LSKSSEAEKGNESASDSVLSAEAAENSASSNRRPPIPLEELVGSMQQTSQKQMASLSAVNSGTSDGDISSIDVDGDGTISMDEYDTLISQLGIKDAASAEDFFAQYDTDANGEITSAEMDASKPTEEIPPMGPPPEEMQTASSYLDTDGDGTVSLEEYQAAVTDLGIEDTEAADALFDKFDTNSDGKITADEILVQQNSEVDTEDSTSTMITSDLSQKIDSHVFAAYEANYQYLDETDSSTISSII
jgi:Ca2+-binding EF-hand superfamily protein